MTDNEFKKRMIFDFVDKDFLKSFSQKEIDIAFENTMSFDGQLEDFFVGFLSGLRYVRDNNISSTNDFNNKELKENLNDYGLFNGTTA